MNSRDINKQDAGIVCIEGLHALRHVVRFGGRIERVLVTSQGRVLAEELCPEEIAGLESRGLVEIVSPGQLEAQSPRSIATGCIAWAQRPELEPTRDRPTIALQNPKNLHNLGSIIRTLAAFDLSLALLECALDPFHPVITRTSAGLNFALPIGTHESLSDLPGDIYALDNVKPTAKITDVDLPKGLATYLFGSERSGVTDQARQAAKESLEIPIAGKVSSLSLPHTVAIVAYSVSS